jgi:hypothetical protein
VGQASARGPIFVKPFRRFVSANRRSISMKEYKYLIIGGGMTGGAAVRGIRELDE